MTSPRAALVAAALALAACGTAVTQDQFPKEAETAVANLYELSAPSLDAGEVDLSQFRGKVALVVNTASECGFTVLGFPSNEFGGQEPGDALQIRAFCDSKYDVTFPMFAKVEVKKGAGQSPVYAYLTAATGEVPGWNFCKYLAGKDGRVVAYFNSFVKPDDATLRKAIEDALR